MFLVPPSTRLDGCFDFTIFVNSSCQELVDDSCKH